VKPLVKRPPRRFPRIRTMTSSSGWGSIQRFRVYRKTAQKLNKHGPYCSIKLQILGRTFSLSGVLGFQHHPHNHGVPDFPHRYSCSAGFPCHNTVYPRLSKAWRTILSPWSTAITDYWQYSRRPKPFSLACIHPIFQDIWYPTSFLGNSV
jgi:hypothetical protein